MKTGKMFKKEFNEYYGEFLSDIEDMSIEQLKELEKVIEKRQIKIHENDKMKTNLRKEVGVFKKEKRK